MMGRSRENTLEAVDVAAGRPEDPLAVAYE